MAKPAPETPKTPTAQSTKEKIEALERENSRLKLLAQYPGIPAKYQPLVDSATQESFHATATVVEDLCIRARLDDNP